PLSGAQLAYFDLFPASYALLIHDGRPRARSSLCRSTAPRSAGGSRRVLASHLISNGSLGACCGNSSSAVSVVMTRCVNKHQAHCEIRHAFVDGVLVSLVSHVRDLYSAGGR